MAACAASWSGWAAASSISPRATTRIHAGAGALDLSVALTARDHGLAGLEFLSGVPGTIGGALRMNAGAYGGDMARVVVSAEAVDGAGQLSSP